MKVFLSWSGERSEKAAAIFYWWLSDVIQSLDPWMSSEDIESGTGWNHQIRMALQESNFGLIFVTRSNMNRPWLLFEAGALAKHVADSRSVPLIVDDELELNMLPGPFSQLQARKFSKDSIFKLLVEINALISRPLKNLPRLFEVHWPILEKGIAELPKETGKLPKITTEDQLSQILAILKSDSVNRMKSIVQTPLEFDVDLEISSKQALRRKVFQKSLDRLCLDENEEEFLIVAFHKGFAGTWSFGDRKFLIRSTGEVSEMNI